MKQNFISRGTMRCSWGASIIPWFQDARYHKCNNFSFLFTGKEEQQWGIVRKSVQALKKGVKRAQMDDDLKNAEECDILLPNGFTPYPPFEFHGANDHFSKFDL